MCMPRSSMLLTAALVIAVAQQCASEATDTSLLELLESNEDLSELSRLMKLPGLHQAMMDRQVTLFAPTNDALRSFQGKLDETLLLNHLTNTALKTPQFPHKLTSMVSGNPPLWITRDAYGRFYVNHARVVREDIQATSRLGHEQVMHVIEGVLEPLVPMSVRDAKYFVDLDARKLLSSSTLYNLGGQRLRVFNEQAELNQRMHMFGVAGQHTFFMPIDDAFHSSAPTSGYDYERTRLITKSNRTGTIRKELVDGRVLEGHIVPHHLLFTTQSPTPSLPTVAWLSNGIQVNVTLQPASLQLTRDRSVLNNDDGRDEESVTVQSNTIVGDRSHARGIVVASVVKANIPVQNGVVHLINKPLMIVARSLYEFIMEEGRLNGNRLSRFAQLIRDKGGLFAETLLEAKEGTLLAPSNEAMERLDSARMEHILSRDFLRAEMFGLHFVRERVASNDPRLRDPNGFSTPASLATNRVWFHYSRSSGLMSVEGRGVNATVVEKDIGTINGVIHVIDRVLGIPHLTVLQKLKEEPELSMTLSLLERVGMTSLLDRDPRDSVYKTTIVAPTNSAWNKARQEHSKAVNTLMQNNFPDYTRRVLERHVLRSDTALTFEQLVERSRSSPRRVVEMIGGPLTFTQQGEFDRLNAYKDNYVSWQSVRALVDRPNLECTNGIVHSIDTVFIDDTPPWQVSRAESKCNTHVLAVLSFLLTTINTLCS